MRRKRTGSLVTVRGRLVCRWRENGKLTSRHVPTEQEGHHLLMDVADYRAAGLGLAEAIRKATGAGKPAAPAGTVTVGEAVERYLDQLEGKRKPANLKHDRYRARSILSVSAGVVRCRQVTV